jgi:hypothetical protein
MAVFTPTTSPCILKAGPPELPLLSARCLHCLSLAQRKSAGRIAQAHTTSQLKPAAAAVPAAAAKQQNDNYDDEKRGGIHIEILLGVPLRVFALRVSTPTKTNPLDPYPFPVVALPNPTPAAAEAGAKIQKSLPAVAPAS